MVFLQEKFQVTKIPLIVVHCLPYQSSNSSLFVNTSEEEERRKQWGKKKQKKQRQKEYIKDYPIRIISLWLTNTVRKKISFTFLFFQCDIKGEKRKIITTSQIYYS